MIFLDFFYNFSFFKALEKDANDGQASKHSPSQCGDDFEAVEPFDNGKRLLSSNSIVLTQQNNHYFIAFGNSFNFISIKQHQVNAFHNHNEITVIKYVAI